jgi:Na+/proline symporter
VSYFATGAGKFFSELMGISEPLASAMMILIALSYTITSGLYGVVATDLLQGGLIGIAILIVAGYAMAGAGLPDVFSVSVPMGNGTFQSLATSRESWTSVLPAWRAQFPGEYAIYNLFGISIFFYFLRTTIEGASGTGSYMMQRFYAARNEREVGLLSLFWIFLLSFRWAFVAAIAVLGILYAQSSGELLDPERVLPTVINVYFPAGIKGLLIAALLAAGMSTFDSVVNGGSAYWVRDIYQKFLRPEATERQLIRMSRIASLAIVAAGLLASTTIRNINDIWGWLTMSIGAGMLIPLLLRWYWWRFNGFGFAAGMGTGMAGAIVQRVFFNDLTEYAAFTVIGAVALAVALATTLLTSPAEEEVLKRFYRTTRPFGIWKRFREELSVGERASVRAEHRRDAGATLIAVGWQLSLFLVMMFIVLKDWETLAILAGLLAIFSTLLYRLWYRHLPPASPQRQSPWDSILPSGSSPPADS